LSWTAKPGYSAVQACITAVWAYIEGVGREGEGMLVGGRRDNGTGRKEAKVKKGGFVDGSHK